MTDELIRELIEAIRTLSPEVWSIYMLQIRSQIVADVAWSIVSLISAGLLSVGLRWSIKKYQVASKYDKGEWEAFAIVFSCFLALCILIFCILLGDAGMKIANPEFYAIRILLSHVGG